MKKIIYIFILMGIFITSLYSEISQDSMQKYWDTSRAKEMFTLGKQNLERDLFKVVQIKKEDAKPMLLNTINRFVNNPKYLNDYKNTFFSMDSSVYNSLNKFYNTKVGKKYRKLFTSLEDSIVTHEDIEVKYKELIKNNAISKKKLKLIANIDEELNLIEIKIDYVREFITFMKQVLYPENNVTNEAIDKYMLNYRIIAEKYESMVMPVIFNDFTMEELQKILSYSDNQNLAIELKFIYEGALLFSKQAYRDLKDSTAKLVNIRLCQDYTKSSKYIPSYCKEEWLSRDINTTE